MQSAYSWMGSRIHLVLEDEIADAYNRAQDAWFEAQKDHKERTGAQWDPVNEPLLINWTDTEKKAFDDIGRIINLLVEVNGGEMDIPDEELSSDYLVKL